MSDILPTLESIYTEEYWAPVPPVHNFQSNRLWSRLGEISDRHGSGGQYVAAEVNAELQAIMAQSVTQLLTDAKVERIQEGELVGSEDDGVYAVPGTVLLVDTEKLHQMDRPPLFPPEETFSDEAELSMSAITAFVRQLTPLPREVSTIRTTAIETFDALFLPGLKAWLGRRGVDVEQKQDLGERGSYIKPYERYHFDPEHGDYERKVNVYGFCPNKEGKTVSVALSRYRVAADGHASVFAPAGNGKHMSYVGMPFYARVGQTINTTIDEKHPEYERIRSAYVLGRGVLERVTVKQPAAKRATSGKLVVNPQAH